MTPTNVQEVFRPVHVSQVGKKNLNQCGKISINILCNYFAKWPKKDDICDLVTEAEVPRAPSPGCDSVTGICPGSPVSPGPVSAQQQQEIKKRCDIVNTNRTGAGERIYQLNVITP